MSTETSQQIGAAPKQAARVHGLTRRLSETAFRVYKSLLSPVLQTLSPNRCLYLPTCSEYAYTAMSRFGAVRGTWLAVKRLSRCHPWGVGGLDPVPERPSSADCCGNRASSAAGQKYIDHLP